MSPTPLVFVACTLGLVALWALTHRYYGLGGDAELYAVQAFSRLHVNLASDLFFRGTNQDDFTLFSSLYAGCIAALGLNAAALVLMLTCKLAFFVASWQLTERLTASKRMAFIAVATLIVIPGDYGAFGVFHFAEDWITARSLGEALVIASLALQLSGKGVAALSLSILAMLVHPLMALPGVLALISMRVSIRVTLAACALAVIGSLALVATARFIPSRLASLALMDSIWLEVVHQRSQFLFLRFWSLDDWFKCLRAAISLSLSALVMPTPILRKICIVTLGWTAAGFAIAGSVDVLPVAAVVQGQAWRWEWLSVYLAILLLLPTGASLWREAVLGRLCAVLALGAWLCAPAEGAACAAVSITMYLSRMHIGPRGAKALLGLVPIAVFLLFVLGIDSKGHRTHLLASSPIESLRANLTLQILLLAGAPALLCAIFRLQSRIALGFIAMSLAGVSACALHRALDPVRPALVARKEDGFDNWRNAIRPNDNVLVIPAPVAPSFAWFTLERPSYLSVDQSSGVVFSRSTALEVMRRSRVLLPISDPDWQVLSNLRKGNPKGAANTRPLTPGRLVSICRDPQLAFVIAREDLGLAGIRHNGQDAWNNDQLYDCARVRELNTAG